MTHDNDPRPAPGVTDVLERAALGQVETAVEVDVFLRNETTGEERTYRTIESEPFCDFNWDEGNHSCDCNRSLYFDRAGGIEPDSTVPCGRGQFTARLVRVHDGAVLYEEDPPERDHTPVCKALDALGGVWCNCPLR